MLLILKQTLMLSKIVDLNTKKLTILSFFIGSRVR